MRLAVFVGGGGIFARVFGRKLPPSDGSGVVRQDWAPDEKSPDSISVDLKGGSVKVRNNK